MDIRYDVTVSCLQFDFIESLKFDDESRFGERLFVSRPPPSLSLAGVSEDNFIADLDSFTAAAAVGKGAL